MRSFITILVACIVVALPKFAGAATPFGVAGADILRAHELFHADQYPSARSAMIDLARQTVEAIRSTDTDDAGPKTITLRDEGMPADFTAAIATYRATIQQMLPNVEFRDVPSQSSDASPTVTVSLSDRSKAKLPWSKAERDAGRFTARVQAGSTRVLTVGFIDKPWADDWATFVNLNSSHRWLLGRSTSPSPGDAEALASARTTVVAQLADLITTEMNARAARTTGPRIKVTHEWTKKLVADSLKRNHAGLIIRDTFVQRFDRPYGDVWQASVLIDASPKIVGELTDSYNRVANAEFGKKATGFGAIAAMGALIVLLYAFCNAVTKGYFMWRLRAFALLAAIAGVLVVAAVT